MQIVVAGKAHPDDNGGKAMVQRMVQFARRDDVREHVVFLEDYDMVLAQHFAAGVDVWINNPRRPAEACGTSGMKMLVNGGLNCSILDGWWDEAYTPRGRLGDRRHAASIPASTITTTPRRSTICLEHAIAPEFYDRDHLGVPRAWIRRVRASMTQLTEQFSSDRMVREYVEQAYLPAARAFLRRAADGARLARELEAWSALLDEQWPGVRFGRMFVHEAEQQWQFEIEAYLGEVCADSVQVQLYAEAAGAEPAACVTIERCGSHPRRRQRVLVPGERARRSPRRALHAADRALPPRGLHAHGGRAHHLAELRYVIYDLRCAGEAPCGQRAVLR